MHEITVHSRHTPREKLEKKYPDHHIIDVTSRADDPWVKFSPFYPHGDIPVPTWGDLTSESVEGLWQGLKVFEKEGIDLSRLEVTSMKGLKRTVRKYGDVHGHLAGGEEGELLGYLEARFQIYLPAYEWALENCCGEELEKLRALAAEKPVVLLDYETNGNVHNLAKPLSHAWLVSHYLMGNWPAREKTD